MVKPITRTYSRYTLDGLALLGQLVCEARLEKSGTSPAKRPD